MSARDELGNPITQQRWEKVLCELELACTKAREVSAYAEQLQADALKVVEGFDEGAFCRDVAHDAESGWAMKLLPYMVALGRLTANVRNPPVAGAALSKNTHGDSNAPPVVGTHEELEPYGTRPSAVEEGSGSNGGARSDELRAGRAQCGARAASAETDRSEVAEGAGAIPARTELNGVWNAERIWVNRITEGDYVGCYSTFVYDSLAAAQQGAKDAKPHREPVEFQAVHSQGSSTNQGENNGPQ